MTEETQQGGVDLELADRIAHNAGKAYEDAGAEKAAKLGDFLDGAYENQGGGEAMEQAVVDKLQELGFKVENAPQGYRIFARTQEQIDAYQERTGIDTTPDPQ